MRNQLTQRIRSFRFALRGIGMMLTTETNALIHALATLVVVAAGWAFNLDRAEWFALILAITIVWVAEAINTAIEAVCDAVSLEENAKIGRAKDLAAGAVLLSAMGATAIAIVVFGRRLVELFVS